MPPSSKQKKGLGQIKFGEAMEKSSSNPNSDSYTLAIDRTFKNLEESAPWIQDTLQQVLIAQSTAVDSFISVLSSAKSRLCQIRSTSSAHFQQSIESLKDAKFQFQGYEDVLFEKVKEGVLVASENSLAAGAVTVGFGLVVLKGPRQFLHRKTMGLFVSEEALLAKYDTKAKELRQRFECLKAEKDKLERNAMLAEEEMSRGRTKLRQAGNQIQRAIFSTLKIERKARGLKDALGDLPKREASRFHSQVSNLVSETKQEQKALSKAVLKISNYGISV